MRSKQSRNPSAILSTSHVTTVSPSLMCPAALAATSLMTVTPSLPAICTRFNSSTTLCHSSTHPRTRSTHSS
ncbi:hypothetical protein BCR44DRAFT_1425545, partial [Catenaria anguillulae PL171]